MFINYFSSIGGSHTEKKGKKHRTMPCQSAHRRPPTPFLSAEHKRLPSLQTSSLPYPYPTLPYSIPILPSPYLYPTASCSSMEARHHPNRTENWCRYPSIVGIPQRCLPLPPVPPVPEAPTHRRKRLCSCRERGVRSILPRITHKFTTRRVTLSPRRPLRSTYCTMLYCTVLLIDRSQYLKTRQVPLHSSVISSSHAFTTIYTSVHELLYGPLMPS